MITPEELLELAKSCEAATEAEIDGRLSRFFGENRVYAYTSSLNDIIALIERELPQANCHGYDKDPKGATAYVSRNCVSSGHWLYESDHCATPALALCAAFCRAMAEKGVL